MLYLITCIVKFIEAYKLYDSLANIGVDRLPINSLPLQINVYMNIIILCCIRCVVAGNGLNF